MDMTSGRCCITSFVYIFKDNKFFFLINAYALQYY